MPSRIPLSCLSRNVTLLLLLLLLLLLYLFDFVYYFHWTSLEFFGESSKTEASDCNLIGLATGHEQAAVHRSSGVGGVGSAACWLLIQTAAFIGHVTAVRRR